MKVGVANVFGWGYEHIIARTCPQEWTLIIPVCDVNRLQEIQTVFSTEIITTSAKYLVVSKRISSMKWHLVEIKIGFMFLYILFIYLYTCMYIK